jgi:putative oxidoreductase
MKIGKVTLILRSMLGFIFVAGPLASALRLAPEPAAPPAAAAFVAALGANGYMLPLLWSTEIAAGVLLLSGFMVPFALTLLAPVIVNIATFHAFLAPNGYPPALLVIALEFFLAWRYRRAFKPLFRTDFSLRASAARQVGADA